MHFCFNFFHVIVMLEVKHFCRNFTGGGGGVITGKVGTGMCGPDRGRVPFRPLGV